MRAGFAQGEITPPIGMHKIGWIVDIVPDSVADPLFVKCAVFDNAQVRIGMIQLDTLSVRWTTVNEIRTRIEKTYGVRRSNVMVWATHNHAGPAVSTGGRVERDDGYIEWLMAKAVEVFGDALDAAREVKAGFGSVFEFGVASNRRVIMRDGTVQTHGSFDSPMALCLEGPIDPEVSVLALVDEAGNKMGCLLNYACHPTHHGGDKAFSAGYPGVMAARMKEAGWPIAMFANGADGNMHHSNPIENGRDVPMEEAGARLAADALKAIGAMAFNGSWKVSAATTTIQLPFRKPTAEELAGHNRGAQRFADAGWYEESIPAMLRRMETMKTQPAEVQGLFIGNIAYVGIPAEYFVEHGLRIKEECHPRHALVVGHANGMVGYVPTKQAFRRGGYETTLAPLSRLAPDAGDLLANAAIRLVKENVVE